MRTLFSRTIHLRCRPPVHDRNKTQAIGEWRACGLTHHAVHHTTYEKLPAPAMATNVSDVEALNAWRLTTSSISHTAARMTSITSKHFARHATARNHKRRPAKLEL